MEKVLSEAKKDGIKIMNCAATPYAVKFYESFGFTKGKNKTVPFYDTKLTFVLMKKKL